MMRTITPAIALAALVFSSAAAGQLFKCKGADGRTVYSDTRCEASASGNALKVSPNSTTGGPRPDDSAPPPKSGAAAGATDAPDDAPSAGSATATARQRYELTSGDRDRIRNLEVTANRLGAYSEQKSAAQLEIQNIRRGGESRLSGSDRDKRDSLTADLSSTDAKKRGQALRELRELYYR